MNFSDIFYYLKILRNTNLCSYELLIRLMISVSLCPKVIDHIKYLPPFYYLLCYLIEACFHCSNLTLLSPTYLSETSFPVFLKC